jgi:hypothetical protein
LLKYPWTELLPNDGRLPVGSDRGAGPLFAAVAVPGIIFLFVRTMRQRALSLETGLLVANIAVLLLWMDAFRIPRFGLPVMVLCCALAGPMLAQLLERSPRVLISLYLAGLLLNGLFCLAGPTRLLLRRFQSNDWSRAAYYGYPPLIDHLPPGTRLFDHGQYIWSSVLGGHAVTNSVRYNGDIRSGDYVLKTGSPDSEDAGLRSSGATLIYDAIPANLFPNVAIRWRIYRVP